MPAKSAPLTNLPDNEQAKQLNRDLAAREAEVKTLDAENRELVHKLNEALNQ